MEAPASKWNVYEYMRQVMMRHGAAPTLEEVSEAFEDAPAEVVEEGIQEFNLTVYGRFMKGEGVDVSADDSGAAIRPDVPDAAGRGGSDH